MSRPDKCRACAGPLDGHGWYTTRRKGSVQRFRCRKCHLTVSTQTFDPTYRLQKSGTVDAAICQQVAAGKPVRQIARALGINRKTVYHRIRRMARGIF